MCFDQVLCGAYASLGCELLGGCGQHSLLREERGGRCSRTTAGCNEDQWLREPSQQASGCDAGPCLSTGDLFLGVRSPALSHDRADIPRRVSVFQKHSKPGPALILFPDHQSEGPDVGRGSGRQGWAGAGALNSDRRCLPRGRQAPRT